MTDVSIGEIEPRPLIVRTSNPLCIKEITKDFPEVSLVLSNSNSNEIKTPQSTSTHRISKTSHQFFQPEHTNRGKYLLHSPRKPTMPRIGETSGVLAVTPPNTYQQQHRPVTSPSDKYKLIKPTGTDLKNHKYSLDYLHSSWKPPISRLHETTDVLAVRPTNNGQQQFQPASNPSDEHKHLKSAGTDLKNYKYSPDFLHSPWKPPISRLHETNDVLGTRHVNTGQQELPPASNPSDKHKHFKTAGTDLKNYEYSPDYLHSPWKPPISRPHETNDVLGTRHVNTGQQQLPPASNPSDKHKHLKTAGTDFKNYEYSPDYLHSPWKLPISRLHETNDVLDTRHLNTGQQQLPPVSNPSDKHKHLKTAGTDLKNYEYSPDYLHSPWKPPMPPLHETNDALATRPVHTGQQQHRRVPSPKVNGTDFKNHNYTPDLRLKFYQKIQNMSKPLSDNIMNPSMTKPMRDVRKSPSRRTSLRVDENKDIDVFNVSEESSIVNKAPAHENITIKSNCSNNSDETFNKERVRQLANLINIQTTQIQSLKMQIASLIALNKEKIKNQKLMSTVRYVENKTKPQFLMQQNQQITQVNKNTSCAMLENKISVGVMTSLEFTLQNKQINCKNDEVAHQRQIFNSESDKNNFILSENVINSRNSLERQRNSSTNILNQNHYYNRGELQTKEQQFTRKINMEQNAGLSSFNVQDKYFLTEENEVFKSAVQPKIGWTFYNNILCQVNEILNTSHDVRQPTQHLYNTIMQQKSTARQLKIFEAKITDRSEIISTNINQKITTTVDTSYYPKVSYQTNVIPSIDSVTDSNTSFHMRALAMKYLGKQNYAESMIMNEKMVSRVLIDNDHGHTNNISMRTRNYFEKRALLSNENSFINIDARRNYHQNKVPDVSMLEQQRKLF